MSWEVVLILVAALGAAVNAGAFFAFSNFVMPALVELVPADGAVAMQAINRPAPNPLFVAAIVGTMLVALPVIVVDANGGSTGGMGWLVAAAVLSAMSFIVTVACNVPRNNALAEADAAALTTVWSDYVVEWTRWNTVRTVTSAASVAAFGVALLQR